MLGKQWLNRYASTDIRGSAIERSQNRQRKLDGIIRWYFDSVMESLPLMLQLAFLHLGCALSRYLWEVNITIASVVLGFTSFGLLFYIFILIAGTLWESCPYQTPGSTFFRYVGPTVRSLRLTAFRESMVVLAVRGYIRYHRPFSSEGNTTRFFRDLVEEVPVALAMDVRRLGRAVVQPLYTPLLTAHRFIISVYTRLRGTFPTPERRLDHQLTLLDFRCTSWTLRTSLEKPVHHSALNYLLTIAEYTKFDPTVVMDCFHILVGYIDVSNGKVVVIQGSQELATLSARCLFQTSRNLSTTDPNSGTLADLRRRYDRVFPPDTDFRGLPFYNTMTNIRALVNNNWNPRFVEWTDYRPSDQELIPFARHMVEVAQEEYQRMETRKVPRWILRFALQTLSLDPPSPPSAIADCLTIISIDLHCDVSSVQILDERYLCCILSMSNFLTRIQRTSGASLKHHYSEDRNDG